MTTQRQTTDAFLNRAQVALDNARQTPEIFAALSMFGYDEARLDQGRALLDAAVSRHAAQRQAYGAQYAATEALNQARHAADELYMVHRRLTRLVLNHDATRRRALGPD